MTTVDTILDRVKNGSKIKFFQGFYGNQWVELKSGWLIPRKTRYELTVDEIYALKSELKRLRPSQGELRARTAA